MPFQIIRQDITKINCDAIVNPTNDRLMPTGGVDAAVHKAAGAGLLAETKKIGSIKTGEAVITQGFCLGAKYVVHTAGPKYSCGSEREVSLLKSCYINSLKKAFDIGCESVAVPLISSGECGFPKDGVLKIAMQAISGFLLEHEMMVYLAVYDKKAYEISSKIFCGIETYIDDNYVLSDFQKRRRAEYPQAKAKECGIKFHIAEAECCAPVMPSQAFELLSLDESFAVRLLKLIDLKGMDDVACYKRANVSKQTWYKIMNDKSYKPNKKTVLSFAFALNLSLDETQELLESVGFILSRSSLFDVIIMYCLENGIYDMWEIDSVLFKYDQETLFSKA